MSHSFAFQSLRPDITIITAQINQLNKPTDNDVVNFNCLTHRMKSAHPLNHQYFPLFSARGHASLHANCAFSNIICVCAHIFAMHIPPTSAYINIDYVVRDFVVVGRFFYPSQWCGSPCCVVRALLASFNRVIAAVSRDFFSVIPSVLLIFPVYARFSPKHKWKIGNCIALYRRHLLGPFFASDCSHSYHFNIQMMFVVMRKW